MKVETALLPVRQCQTYLGAVMNCSGRDVVQKRIRFFGVFEPNLSYYTAARLQAGDLYVDIGANVGYFTLLAAKCVGDRGKVIAVEADPETFQQLARNVRLNNLDNVVLMNVAATGERCQVSIKHGDPRNSGSNQIAAAVGALAIEGLPLHAIVGDDIAQVSFIKIDIEGSEAAILDAILESLDGMREDLVVAAEISKASAPYVGLFVAYGFRAYAIANIYQFDYYLLKSALRWREGEQQPTLLPVNEYDPAFTDYVLERMPASN